MEGLRFLPSMFILSHLFYLKSGTSLTPVSHYVKYICQQSNSGYTSGSSFHLALNYTLFLKLQEKASKATLCRVTNGTGINQVNALFYCRADVRSTVCHDCVKAAVQKIVGKCPFKKEAIVWFEECTLRYANRSIFSSDEETPMYIYTNNSGILNDFKLDPFKEKFNIAMAVLVKEVAYSRNLKGSATTKVNISSSEVLHCGVQCSPDITGLPCERCLIYGLSKRKKWADTMIFMPSCFIRVDLHKSTLSSILVIPSPRPSPDIEWVMLLTVIILASKMFGIAVLAAAIYYLCRRPVLTGIDGLRVFTFPQLSKATGRFNADNYLGEGGFSKVYKGVLSTTGQDIVMVAVKRLKTGTYHGHQEFLLEMRNNSRARHENVVSLIGYCITGKDKLLVYEFMPRNCLHKNLHGDNTTREELTAEIRMKIALGTAKGLEYLHESNPKIIHRDIKSANILLDSDFEPKVADFGLAKSFPDGASRVMTQVRGTESYLDPDYFESNQLTEKSDVYSFGIVLLELITGSKPRRLANSGRTDLLQALNRSRSADFIDWVLMNEDNQVEQNVLMSVMTRMMICAALCIHPSSKCRLKMSQVVRLLEAGNLLAGDVAHIIAYATSTTSNTQSDTFEQEDLIKLAIEVHEKGNEESAQQQNNESRLSNATSYASACSNVHSVHSR